MKLREISGQYLELQELANTDDESMAVAIRDTMEAIEGEFEDKAKALVVVTQNMDDNIDAIDAEIKRLTARKKAIVNRKQSLTDYLRTNMEACGITKISCPLFTISCVKGKEVVVVDQESIIPDDLMRVSTKIEPDKVAIIEKLKAGEEVPGCHMERAQSSIRIK